MKIKTTAAHYSVCFWRNQDIVLLIILMSSSCWLFWCHHLVDYLDVIILLFLLWIITINCKNIFVWQGFAVLIWVWKFKHFDSKHIYVLCLFMVVHVSLLLLVWNGRTEWCNSETAACCMYLSSYSCMSCSVIAPCSENKWEAKNKTAVSLWVLSVCHFRMWTPWTLKVDVTMIINTVLMCWIIL